MNIEAAREQMIEQQLRTWAVLDPKVLETVSAVPREKFVPDAYTKLAFADTMIPLAHEQVMFSPSVEGRMLQALDLKDSDEILEIGTGTGFVTACLSRLGGRVTSLDLFDDFTARARRNLDALGSRNVDLVTTDANTLDPERHYDAIAVTASLPLYVPVFQQALNVGGRLFLIVGEAPTMEARLIRRLSKTDWHTESLFETVVPALINAPRRAGFVF